MSDHPEPIRVFLDSNVLYSAAIGGRVSRLWDCPGVSLVASEYVIAEAWTNLCENVADAERRERCLDALADLANRCAEIRPAQLTPPLFLRWELVDPDDVPIRSRRTAAFS